MNRQETINELYKKVENEAGGYFIPAREKEDIYSRNTRLRVCAYCRVSTDNDAQLTSFELQQKHYQNLVGSHPNWDLQHIYADEGISGTSLKKRDEFNAMIAACREGKYDLIVTKAVSRFARNLIDCVSLVRELKAQNPPVGVFFETDGLYTITEDSELRLSILASFAQEESVKKSESMIWSLKERFKSKKLLTPELYGYRRPRDAAGGYIKYGILEIEESEAAVIRFIFNAFLAGYSADGIASLLTDLNVPTKLGNKKWNSGSINYILRNERYCGSVLTWKTFTYDIYEHKKRKNKQNRDQYLYEKHHPAIITIEQYEAAQTLLENRRHGMRGGLHFMHVIDMGVFQGYVPINHHWCNDDPNAYYDASDSVRVTKTVQKVKRSYFSNFDLTGYQVVRGQFLTARSELPCMNFSAEKIMFNTSVGKKLTDYSYIQLLLHPTERKIAIRPCDKNDTFSIAWRTSKGQPVLIKTISCPHFNKALFQIMEWNPDFNYRVLGTWIEKGDDKIMIFNLSNAMPLVLFDTGESGKRKRRTAVCPEEWEDSFGDEFYNFSLDNDLYYSKRHGDWNSGADCVMVDGQTQVPILTHSELMESAERIKNEGGDNQ